MKTGLVAFFVFLGFVIYKSNQPLKEVKTEISNVKFEDNLKLSENVFTNTTMIAGGTTTRR